MLVRVWEEIDYRWDIFNNNPYLLTIGGKDETELPLKVDAAAERAGSISICNYRDSIKHSERPMFIPASEPTL
ncbi:hypothetical protein J6590_049893 [Homalodisca vitripennis]|nr:hypothetical protein J6590_049893 [Homalodisca vitripennis]